MLKGKLQTEEETLQALCKAKEKADTDYQAQKEAAEKAAQRLTTMKMSLDEKNDQRRWQTKKNLSSSPPMGTPILHLFTEKLLMRKTQRLAKKIFYK